MNGKLIKKYWNLHFSGQRKFDINDHELVIDVSVKPKDYYCKAFLDGQLYIEELFHDFKARIEQGVKPASPIKRVVFILVWAAIFLSIFAQLHSNA